MRRNGTLLSLAVLWASMAPLPALAGEPGSHPQIHGEILFELQNDWTHRSDDRAEQLNDLYLTIEPSLVVGFTEAISLETGLVIEPVLDPRPAKSRWFGDQGIYVETLFLSYRTDRFGVRGGKIHPGFGIAWDAAPGIYGVDFAEDYEISERIGLGGFVELGNDRLGDHRLTADLFFLDDTFLSASWPHDRGRIRRSDGGVSNTGDLRSFSVTLQGEAIPRIPGLGYHLGFSQQHAGRGGLNERGYVAAITHESSLTDEIDLELLAEYVYQHGAEGADQNRWYLTQGAGARYRGWNLALSYTRRELQASGESDLSDHLFQVSVGYEFDMGLSIALGWRHAREGEVESQGLGALIGYRYAF